MNAQTIIATALQIGASAAPEIPAIIGIFNLASTLVSEAREPTTEEAAQMQTSIDTAHQQAQSALAAAQAAVAALTPIKAALSTAP